MATQEQIVNAIKSDRITDLQHADSVALKKAYPDLDNLTPAMYAIRYAKNSVVKFLLDKGIANVTDSIPKPKSTSIYGENHSNDSMADYARTHRNYDAIKIFAEHGLPIDNDLIISAFQALMFEYDMRSNTRMEKFNKSKELFLYLIEQPGVNVNDINHGKSLLFLAIDYGLDDDIVKALRRNGAKMRASNMNMNNMRDVETIESSIDELNVNSNNTRAFSDKLVTRKKYIDMDWIKEQISYVTGLSEYDKNVLIAYTFQGDVIVNSFVRGTFDKDKFLSDHLKARFFSPFNRYIFAKRGITSFDTINREEFYADLTRNFNTYIDSFAKDLQRILLTAPPTKVPIKLYRGIKDPRYMYAELRKSRQFQTSDFQSTSVSAEKAVSFAEDVIENKVGAVIEILIATGTHCLFMEAISNYSGELEVLLPMNIQMMHLQTRNKEFISNGEGHMVSVIEMETINP